MTTTSSSPTIILIAGHWLGAWAWDEVGEYLSADGYRAVAMTLPGLDEHDPERTTRTLDDQAAAILDAIARSRVSRVSQVADDQPVILVAHSGANAPVSLVLDRHPELVDRVVWVDSGPMAAGTVFDPDFPEELQELALPPFELLAEQASLEGLSAEMLERFRAKAVPEPGPVLRQRVELTNDDRRKVPTTLVCCSLPGPQVLELAQAGHPMFAEVANLEDLEVIDLATGHWPMWSRPADLAKAIESTVSSTR